MRRSESIELPLTITALLITSHANASTAAVKTTPVGKLFYHRINYSALGGKQDPLLLFYGRADDSLLLVYVFANVFLGGERAARIEGPLHHRRSAGDRADWRSSIMR